MTPDLNAPHVRELLNSVLKDRSRTRRQTDYLSKLLASSLAPQVMILMPLGPDGTQGLKQVHFYREEVKLVIAHCMIVGGT